MGARAVAVQPMTVANVRGLRRDAAASYVGVSPTKFDELVQDGRMPKPKRIDGCVIWDRFKLDLAFEAIDEQDGSSDWD